MRNLKEQLGDIYNPFRPDVKKSKKSFSVLNLHKKTEKKQKKNKQEQAELGRKNKRRLGESTQ